MALTPQQVEQMCKGRTPEQKKVIQYFNPKGVPEFGGARPGV